MCFSWELSNPLMSHRKSGQGEESDSGYLPDDKNHIANCFINTTAKNLTQDPGFIC